jgi:transcription initiation factor TFIID subunit TAF12
MVPYKRRFSEKYTGKPGDEVYISVNKKKNIFHLINAFTDDMIDKSFTTEKDARDYVKKKLLVLSDDIL